MLATPELCRIRDAERFDWRLSGDTAAMVASWTAALKTSAGQMTLRDVQAWTLGTLYAMRGCYAPIVTNGGKTLIALLAGTAVNAQRIAICCPASLRETMRKERDDLSKHWHIRPCRFFSYEGLGNISQKYSLEKYAPDILICDESDCLKNLDAGVTKRIGRYAKEAKVRPILLFMSGSDSSGSIKDYWHLLRWTLGNNAPVPANPMEMNAWCCAIDDKVNEMMRMQPGALLTLSAPAPEDEEQPIEGELDDIYRARLRFARRLLSTRGVVGSGGSLPKLPLRAAVVVRTPSVAVMDAARIMRDSEETPCGFPIDTAFDMWRHERELSCGLYYRWKVRPPQEWLDRRKDWSKFIRDKLSRSRTYDTASDIAAAITRGDIKDSGVYAAWREIEPVFKPETEPVWICYETLRYAAEWLQRTRGICWVKHRAFGDMLASGTGVPFFNTGASDARGTKIDMWDGPAIASIDSCRKGFNLHTRGNWRKASHYANLVITCPTKNRTLEQLISRTHRDGSDWPEVHVEFLQQLEGDANALAQARREALHKQQTSLSPQRLTAAIWTTLTI